VKGPALAVMARAPVPGGTKTRLQPGLTPEQSAAISRAFLIDTIDLAVSLPQYTPFLAFTPRKDRPLFESLTPTGMELIEQAEGDLGQRMYHLMHDLEKAGYCPVVIIGTDIPTLQPATLLQALEALKTADLCLGPARDGGYYLIGARHADERILKDIPWSMADVLKLTIQRAKEAGLSLTRLEEYSDIDTFADLMQLYSNIKRLRATPGGRIPLHTEAWLKGLRVTPQGR